MRSSIQHAVKIPVNAFNAIPLLDDEFDEMEKAEPIEAAAEEQEEEIEF